MQLRIYKSVPSKVLETNSFESLIQFLPEQMRKRAKRYHFEKDGINFLIGRLLLKQALFDFNSSEAIENIYLNENQKPLLNTVQFNISHTEDMVICAVSNGFKIGVDIEKLNQINFEDFTQMFSENEWSYIKGSQNPLDCFYKYWTRKESIIKTLGLKLSDLHRMKLEANLDQFVFDNTDYYLYDLFLQGPYIGALCTNQPELQPNQLIELNYFLP